MHQLFSLEATYKSQGRPKLWGVGRHPNLNFGGVWYEIHSGCATGHWLEPCL